MKTHLVLHAKVKPLPSVIFTLSLKYFKGYTLYKMPADLKKAGHL